MAKQITTRLYFLELLAYWQGRVTAGAVAEQFGLSRQQGQAAMNDYQALAPHNLSLGPKKPLEHSLSG